MTRRLLLTSVSVDDKNYKYLWNFPVYAPTYITVPFELSHGRFQMVSIDLAISSFKRAYVQISWHNDIVYMAWMVCCINLCNGKAQQMQFRVQQG